MRQVVFAALYLAFTTFSYLAHARMIDDDTIATDDQIRVIKKILLAKLGMKSEPQASLQDIPQKIVDHRHSMQAASVTEYEKMQAIVTAEYADLNKLRFKFNNTVHLKTKKVFSAILYLYLDEQNVSPDQINVARHGKVITKTAKGEEGWIAKNITKDLKRWLRRTNSEKKSIYTLTVHGMKISARNKAYLNVEYHNMMKKRDKRNSKCDNSDKCCRRRLHISVAQLKWDSWLHSPKSFDYYYCSGRCAKRDKSLYGQFLSGVLNSTSPGCCVPSKLRGLRVMHINEQKILYEKELEDIMADDCVCMGS